MPTDPPVGNPDRDYRQRAAATRLRKKTPVVLDAAERALLARLASHPLEPLSQWNMKDLCAEASVHRTTMLRRFKTVEAVGAAVAERMQAEQREVPVQIADLAERHARDESWKHEVQPEHTRLLAHISNKNPTVEELHRDYEAAVSRASAKDDQTEIIYWCTELTEAYFSNCQRENLRLASKPLDYAERREVLGLARQSLDYAERGLSLVDPDDDNHCMLGFRLTQTAARAELLLSTKQLTYETTGLSRIRSLKDLEIGFARQLGWELKAELARFHRDRSAALCDDRVEPEITSIQEITSTLLRMCTPSAAQDRPRLDTVPADELCGVIARLCAVEMAYAQDQRYVLAYRKAFPHGTEHVKTALLECFSAASGEDTRQEQADIAGLIQLQKLGAVIDEARSTGADPSAAIHEYEHAPVDLLRSARFGIIRHVLVARYLTAKGEMKIGQRDGGTASDADGSATDASSTDLIESAIYFYTYAEAVTRRRGAGGTLRKLAKRERKQLLDRHPKARKDVYANPRPVPATEFDEFQKAINDLVLKGFTWRPRLDGDEVGALQDLINPVGRYLGRGQR